MVKPLPTHISIYNFIPAQMCTTGQKSAKQTKFLLKVQSKSVTFLKNLKFHLNSVNYVISGRVPFVSNILSADLNTLTLVVAL